MSADFDVNIKETKSKQELEQELESLTKKYIGGEIKLDTYRIEVSKLEARFNLGKVTYELKPILFSSELSREVISRDLALRVEVSQERMEGKIDELMDKVATREDLVEKTNQLLQYQQQANESLQNKIEILRSMQEANVPHKKLAKYAFAFLTFFSFSFLSEVFFDVTIITHFWNNLGLFFSFGFLVMSFLMGIDWQEQLKKK